MPHENDTFCILPWSRMEISNIGCPMVCCHFEDPITADDGSPMSILSHTLAEIWNAGRMRHMRREMAEGNRVSGCRRCYELEDAGGISMRQQVNADADLTAVPRLKEEARTSGGTCHALPSELTLYLGNLCNLKCRMCSGWASSRIARDPVHDKWAREAGAWQAAANQQPWRSEDVIQNKLLRHPEQIRSLTFMGGEPLLFKEVGDILQYLIDAGVAHNIVLNFATNATTTNVPWLKLAEEFKYLDMTVSIDGFGKDYEYTRYPAKWSALDRNLQTLIHLPNTCYSANVTLQNYNALSVVDLFRYLDSIGMEFFLAPLYEPAHLSTKVMPPRARQLGAGRLRDYAEWDCRPKNQETVLAAANKLESEGEEFDLGLMRDFMLFTNDLDSSRGQSFAETFPELLALIEEAGVAWTGETLHAGRHSLPVLQAQ